MPPQSTAATPHTFVLHRTYSRSSNRVFALLATPDARRRWMFEDEGTILDSYEVDVRVGGTERATYSIRKGSPVDGLPFVNEGMFLDIVSGQRVVFAYYMSIGGRRISASQVTFELADSGDGCALTFTHQAVFFEGADGPAMREHGWNVLLDKLAAASISEPR